MRGYCDCGARYSGVECEVELCPKGCSVPHGACVGGACECTPEWSGADCATSTCPTRPANSTEPCSGHGTCHAGTCHCEDTHKGEACEIERASRAARLAVRPSSIRRPACLHTPSPPSPAAGHARAPPPTVRARRQCAREECTAEDHGFCANVDKGPCTCLTGWLGPACATALCPDECSGNGFCTDSGCSCYPSYRGRACEHSDCPNECSGHGKCSRGKCDCEKGAARTLSPPPRRRRASPGPFAPTP